MKNKKFYLKFGIFPDFKKSKLYDHITNIFVCYYLLKRVFIGLFIGLLVSSDRTHCQTSNKSLSEVTPASAIELGITSSIYYLFTGFSRVNAIMSLY